MDNKLFHLWLVHSPSLKAIWGFACNSVTPAFHLGSYFKLNTKSHRNDRARSKYSVWKYLIPGKAHLFALVCYHKEQAAVCTVFWAHGILQGQAAGSLCSLCSSAPSRSESQIPPSFSSNYCSHLPRQSCKHQPHLPKQLLLTLYRLQSLLWRKDWDVMQSNQKAVFEPYFITDLHWWRTLRKQLFLQLDVYRTTLPCAIPACLSLSLSTIFLHWQRFSPILGQTKLVRIDMLVRFVQIKKD